MATEHPCWSEIATEQDEIYANSKLECLCTNFDSDCTLNRKCKLSVVGRLCGRDNIGFEVELDEPS